MEALSIVNLDPSKLVASPYVIEFYNKIGTETPDSEPFIIDPEAIPNNKLCPICCEREINSIFLPCGHIYCCMECCYNIDPCPICRSDITMRNKVHMA